MHHREAEAGIFGSEAITIMIPLCRLTLLAFLSQLTSVHLLASSMLLSETERESLDTPLVLFLFYHNYMGSGYLNTYIRIPIIIFFRALTFSLPLSLVGKNL